MEVMDKMDNRELISALADGQLQGEAFARGVQVAAGDAGGRAAWCSYQVVSEVLRTGRASTTGTPPEVFLARLQKRLHAEQAGAAPVPVAVPVAVRQSAPAANDWRWKLTAGFASLAAVVAVGWNVWGSSNGAGQPQLASATTGTPATLAAANAAPMIRDSRLDQLLAAHRQLGGATALGNSSGFLRNATFEGPTR
jgi:sigma-E factor negative regulatory protein RseA